MNINGGKSKSNGGDKDNERSKAAKNILAKLKSENARLSDLVVKTEVIFEFRIHNSTYITKHDVKSITKRFTILHCRTYRWH